MAKRFVFWLGLFVFITAAVVLGVPSSRYAALGMIKQEPFYDNRPVGFWLHALKDPDAATRKRAAFALGCVCENCPGVAPDLGQALSDEDTLVRLNASLALFKMGRAARGALPQLCATLKDPSVAVRMNAAFALARLGPEADGAVPALIEALDDPDNRVEIQYFHRSIRGEVAFALGRVGPAARAAVPALAALRHGDDPELRALAADALQEIDPDAAARENAAAKSGLGK
jgi:HEAT repeat protein